MPIYSLWFCWRGDPLPVLERGSTLRCFTILILVKIFKKRERWKELKSIGLQTVLSQNLRYWWRLSGTCCNLILFCLVLESQNIDLVSICVILQEHGSIFAKYFCNCVELLPFWESNILPHRALPTEDTCSSRGDWNRGAMIWWMQWRPGQKKIWRQKVDFVEPKRAKGQKTFSFGGV